MFRSFVQRVPRSLVRFQKRRFAVEAADQEPTPPPHPGAMSNKTKLIISAVLTTFLTSLFLLPKNDYGIELFKETSKKESSTAVDAVVVTDADQK
jgi:hypothetical protein